MNAPFEKNLISTKEAGIISGYNSDYIARLCRAGKIEGKQFGRAWFVDKESLEKFLTLAGNRKQEFVRTITDARAKEYRTAQSTIVKVKKTLNAPILSPITRAISSSWKREAGAIFLALIVVGSGAYIAHANILTSLAERAQTIAENTAIGFTSIATEQLASFTEKFTAVENSERLARTSAQEEISRTSIALAPEYLSSPNIAIFAMNTRDVRDTEAGAKKIAVAPMPMRTTLAVENVYTVSPIDLSVLRSPARMQQAVLSFAENTYLAGVHSAHEFLASVPEKISLINLALGNAIISASHLAISSDVNLAYGISETAPASARVTVALLGSVGDSLASLTAQVPGVAVHSYLALADTLAETAPKVAQAGWRAEYGLATGFVSGTNDLLALHYSLIGVTGNLAYQTTDVASRGVSVALATLPKLPLNTLALEDAFLGTVGKSVVAVQNLASVASASPSLNAGERAALYTYTTIQNLFDGAGSALAVLVNPAPVVLPTPVIHHTAPTAVSTTTPAVATVATSATNPVYNYTTVVNGASNAFVNESIGNLRNELLNSINARLQPIQNQVATNVTTIQQVNMIQSLTDLILHTPKIDGATINGGNLTNLNNVASANGTFTTLTAGTVSLATTTLAGDFSVSGTATVGNLIATNATTTNATSTNLSATNASFANLVLPSLTQGSALFAGANGAISQDNANFFYDAATQRLGLGTVSPTTHLQVAGTGFQQISASTTDVTTSSLAGFQATSDRSSLQVLSHGSARTVQRYGITLGGWTEISDFDNLGASNGLVIGVNAASPLVFGTSNTERARISGTGNFGIGTTSPFANLSIHANNGSTNTTLFNIGSSTAIATTSLFTVLNSGNVGIGTTSPSFPLSVTGVIYSTAGFRFPDGSIQTVAAAGAASVPTGSVGQLPYYALAGNSLAATSSISLSTTGAFIVNGGASQIGIGTTSPSAGVALDINSGNGFNLWNQTGATWQKANLSYVNGAVNVLTLSTQTNSGGTNQDIALKAGTNTGLYVNASGQTGIGYTNNMDTSVGTALNVNGRLGVGTNSPQSVADFAANGSNTGNLAYGLRIVNTNASNQSTNIALVGGGSAPVFVIGTDLTANNSGGFFIGTSTSGNTPATQYGTNATAPFQINNEGTIGLLNFASAPATTAKRIYQFNGNLYFDGTQLNGAGITDNWSLTSSNLTPASLTYNVGVGTTTPFGKFAINGTAGGSANLLTVASSTAGFATTTVFQIDQNGITTAGQLNPIGPYTTNLSNYSLGSTAARWNQVWAGTVNVGTSTFSIGANSASGLGFYNAASGGGTQVMTLATSGNVGIGTTTPYGKLSVYGAPTGDTDIITANSSGTSGSIRFLESNAQRFILGFGDNGSIATGQGTDSTVLRAFSGSLHLITGLAATTGITIDTSGNVGIGTTSPTQVFSVDGASGAQILVHSSSGAGASLALADTGTTKYATIKSQGNDMLFQTNGSTSMILGGGNGAVAGSVGIGTTSPQGKLNVYGSAIFGGVGNSNSINSVLNGSGYVSTLAVVGTSDSGVNVPNLQLADTLNSSSRTWSLANGRANPGELDLFVSASKASDPLSGGSQIMTFLSGGNIGIGATSPANLLHIAGTSAAVSATQLTLEGRYNGYGAGIDFTSRTSSGGTLVSMAKITADGESSWDTTAANQDAGLRFFTTLDGTQNEKVRILAGGNVGIGTTNPATKLHVYSASNGNANLTLESAGTGDASILFTQNGTQYIRMYSNGASLGNFNILDQEQDNGVSLNHNSNSWAAASDVRLKENIQTMSVLDRLTNFRAVSFDWRSSGNPDIGVIAQELYNVFPEVVNKGSDGSLNGYSLAQPGVWSVEYDKLAPLALEGVKELNEKFNTYIGGGIATTTSVAVLSATTTETNNLCLNGDCRTSWPTFSAPSVPDLSAYAKLSDIPSLSGYALLTNIPDVSNFITASALTPYATTASVASAIASSTPDLSSYATTLAVNSAIASAIAGIATTSASDLSSYAKLSDLSSATSSIYSAIASLASSIPSPVSLGNIYGSLTGSLVPTTDNTFNLGSPTNRLANVYGANINAGDLTYSETSNNSQAVAAGLPSYTFQQGDVVALYVNSTSGGTHTVPVDLGSAVSNARYGANNIFFNTTGSVSVGIASSTAPRGKLDVERSSTSGDIRLLTLANTGATGALPYSAYVNSAGDFNLASNDDSQGSLVNATYGALKLTLSGASNGGFSISSSSATTQSYSTLFKITNDGNVGIGTTTPSGQLEVVKEGATANLYLTTYASSLAGSQIVFRDARGTAAAPTAVQLNDRLGSIGVRGYGATAFTSVANALFNINAAENWTNSAQGTNFTFETTAAGGTTRTEKMRIDSNGNVGIGTTSPGSLLSVGGNAYFGQTGDTTITIGSGSTGTNAAGLILNSGSSLSSSHPGAYIGFGVNSTQANVAYLGESGFVLSSVATDFAIQGASGKAVQIWGGGRTTAGGDLQVTSGGNVIAAGNVGIGTTTIGNGAALTSYIGTGSYAGVFGSNAGAIGIGTWSANGAAMIQGGANTMMASAGPIALQPYSGNVGIGSTTPSTKLVIYGGASGGAPYNPGTDTFLTIENSGRSVMQFLSPSSADTEGFYFGTQVSPLKAQFVYQPNLNDFYWYTSTGGQTMTLDGTGHLGIGTTTPLSTLSIVTANSTVQLPNSGNTPTGSLLSLKASANNALFMGIDTASPFGGYLQMSDVTDLSVHYPLLLNPRGGNVGIGTTTPGNNLVVQGSTNGSGINVVTSASNASPLIRFYTNGVNKGGIGAAANNGDGGTGTLAGDMIILADGAAGTGNMDFLTNNAGSYAARMVLTAAGNVGIGTTSPVFNSGFGTGLSIQGSYPVVRFYGTGAGAGDYQLGADSNGYMSLTRQGGSASSALTINAPTTGSANITLNRSSNNASYSSQVSFSSGGTADWALGTSQGAAASRDWSLYSYGGAGNVLTANVTTGVVSGNLNNTSDARLKTNISPLSGSEGLAAINQLRPVHYDWKNPNMPGNQLGFLAQDVQQIFPGLVQNSGLISSSTPDGTLTLSYAGLEAPIVQAIQELSQQVNALAGVGTTTIENLIAVNATTTSTNMLCLNGDCRSAWPSIASAPDLSSYAHISDLPSLSGYALLSNIPDVSSFITTSALTPYATVASVNSAISSAIASSTPDLSSYAKTVDVSSAIASAIAGIATTTAPDLSSYAKLSDLPSLATYATNASVAAAIAAIPPADLSSYATTASVNAAIAAIPPQDLSGLATKSSLASATSSIYTAIATLASSIPSPVSLGNIYGSLTGNLVPTTDNTFNLGSPTNRLANVYGANINAGDLTYSETSNNSQAVAGGLPSYTFQQGDVVALYVNSTSGGTHTVPVDLGSAVSNARYGANNIFFNTTGMVSVGIASSTAPRGKLDVERSSTSGDIRLLTLANTGATGALPYSAYVDASGDFNLASNDDSQGNLINATYGALKLTLSGTGNGFSIASSSKTSLSYSSLFSVNANGNVGIGTTSPWAQLSVNPNALGSGVPEFAIGSSTATHLIVAGTGYVGIGTTTPSVLLSVTNSNNGGLFYGIGSSNSLLIAASGSSNNSGGGFSFVPGSSSAAAINFTGMNTSGVATWGTASGALRTLDFSNTSTGGMKVIFGGIGDLTAGTGTHYVGVGATSTPGALLSIAGYAGGTTPLFMVSSSTSAFATSTVFSIDSNGKVGVGTTSPWALLSINPNALGSGVPEFAIGSSTATHLIVTGSGNVGIGTVSPIARLHINDNVSSTTDQQVSQRVDAIFGGSQGGISTVYGQQMTTRVGPSAGTWSTVQSNFTQALFEGVGTGTITNLEGVFARTGIRGTSPSGTITNGYAFYIDSPTNQSSGSPSVTVGKQFGLYIRNQNATSGYTPTSGAGVAIESQTGATNNIDILYGTGTTPTGNFGIYQGDAYNNYFQGNVGIGTTTPNAPLDVYTSGTVAAVFRGFGATSGAVEMGAVSTATGLIQSVTNDSLTNTANLSINPSGGFVGIGTTSPQTILHLSTIDQSSDRLRLENRGSGGRTWDLVGGLPGINNSNFSIYDLGANATRMTIDSTGNVGIGSTTPWAQLSVNPNALGSGVPEFAIGSSTATHLIVTGAGNVGIGTMSPSQALEVNGKAKFDDNMIFTSGKYLYSSTASGVINIGDSSIVNTISISNSAGSQLLVPQGNVGIGTTSPISTLDVASAAISNTSAVRIAADDTWAACGGNCDGAQLWVTGKTDPRYTMQVGVDTSVGYGFLRSTKRGVASIPLVFQQDGGYIGIGTSTPRSTLSIATEASNLGNNGLYFDIYSPNSSIGGNSTISNIYVARGAVGNQYYFQKYQNSSGTQFSVDSSGNTYLAGNVGIGTTSPSGNLNVYSSTVNAALAVLTNTNTTSNASVPLFLASKSGGSMTNVSIENSGAGVMAFRTGATTETGYGSTRMSISAAGDVGIGTAPIADGSWTTLAVYGPHSGGTVQGGELFLGNSSTYYGVITGNSDSLNLGNYNGASLRMSGITSCSSGIKTDVNGYISCVASDERLKTNIASLSGTDALALIDSLNPVSFDWKNSANGDGIQYGFIAQQVKQVAPSLVATTTPTKGYTTDFTYTLNYQGLIGPAISAIQQLDARTQILTASSTLVSLASVPQIASTTLALAAQMQLHETRLTSLEARVAALESGAIGTGTSTPFSTSTLAAAFVSLGAYIQHGIAQFGTLVADQFVAATNSAGTSSAGTVTILAGNTVAQVTNAYALPTSKIFVTLTASTTGSWYISDKQNGSFKIVLSQPQATDVSLDYFIVQTQGQIATSTPSTGNGVSQGSGSGTITLLGDNPVHVSVGSPYIEPGVSFSGSYVTFVNGVQQDLSQTPLDTSSPITYIITYQATNNPAISAHRSVIVGNPDNTGGGGSGSGSGDTTPPVVTLNGSPAIQIALGDTFTDPGATATDDTDGNLTSSIVVTGSVDTGTAGLYTLTYTATDTAGNAGQVSRVVTVQ